MALQNVGSIPVIKILSVCYDGVDNQLCKYLWLGKMQLWSADVYNDNCSASLLKICRLPIIAPEHCVVVLYCISENVAVKGYTSILSINMRPVFQYYS